jgi:hypothetical protein
MYVVAPASRLRRGVRRLTLAICALILGAGFSPALPSTVETPAAVSFARPPGGSSIAASVKRSTVDIPAPPPAAAPEVVALAGTRVLSGGRHVGAFAGRAPPFTVA